MKKVIFVSINSTVKSNLHVFDDDSLYNKIYDGEFVDGFSSIVEINPTRLVYRFDDPDEFDTQYPHLEKVAAKHKCFVEVVSRLAPELETAADAQ